MEDTKGINIVNVVATATTGAELNLMEIVRKLAGANYDKNRFPGLIYRLDKPKTAMLLFESGKIVCTGGKSVEEASDAVHMVLNKLRKLDIDIGDKLDIKIQNIVATADLGKELNLNTLTITLGLERIEFEPEIFPGLVYREDDPKTVMLIFGSGKVVCTGAKNVDEVKESVDKLRNELVVAGVL